MLPLPNPALFATSTACKAEPLPGTFGDVGGGAASP
jgi:hypothetical protein